MKQAQERVRRFREGMAACGASGAMGDFTEPYIDVGEDADLCSRLQIEECLELCVALSGIAATKAMVQDAMDKIARIEPCNDMETIAREGADIVIVTLNTMNACGIDLAPVFDEVMSANERKVGPGARVRADGKLLKPDGWVGPDVEAVLERQKVAR